MEDTVTRDAFRAAMDSGDLATIERYMAQSHVQQEIRASNYDPHWCSRYDDSRFFSLFSIAAERGFADVIHWFFVLNHSLVAPTLVWTMSRTLGVAVYNGHVEIVELLISSQAFSSLDEDMQQRFLDRSLSDCPFKCVAHVLIAYGANVNALDEDSIQADQLVEFLVDEGFFAACFLMSKHANAKSLSIEKSHRLLDHGVVFHKSVLHVAAEEGLIDHAVLMLTRGHLDVNLKATVDHSTALVHAANSCDDNSSLVLVRLLLDYGVNDSIPGVRGRLAIHIAAKRKRLEVLKLLLDHRLATHGSDDDDDDAGEVY